MLSGLAMIITLFQSSLHKIAVELFPLSLMYLFMQMLAYAL